MPKPPTSRASGHSEGPPTVERLEQALAERTAELEHARQRARELFDQMPALSVTTRRGQDGLPIIEDCNRAFSTALGYTRTEIIGRPLGDFYAPASRTAPETQPAASAEHRLDGLPRQLRDRYGGVLDTILTLAPTTTRSGAFVGTLAVYLDVTERTLEERRRRDLQTRYEALVGQTLVGVCIVQDGAIVDANRKMADLTGYSLEEQTGFLSLLDLVAEQDRPLMADCLLRCADVSAGAQTHVTHIRRKDDVLVPLEVQGGPVEYGGRPAVALVALDISRRIQLQNQIQQAQRLDNIGQLAGGVAHSFNNAMTAIYVRCDALLDRMSQADPRRADVEAILAVASDTTALTQRVLAFGERRTTAPTALDLNVVVGDTLKVAAPLVGQRASLVPSLEPLLGLVEANAAQLEQAVLTILLHARDVTPAGGVVRVTTANVDIPPADESSRPAGGHVTIAIQDGGPGLTRDEAAALFEPGGPERNDELAAVHAVVTQMGGHIRVETAPGQGATITIAFPRAADTAPTGASTAGTARTTVLLAEDEEQVRVAMVGWLERAGYRVLAAADGTEALVLAAGSENEIALLLTDMVMPDMNGKQLAAELERAHGPRPVIFMSGYPTRPTAPEEGRGATMLQKPFVPQALLRAVRASLNQY